MGRNFQLHKSEMGDEKLKFMFNLKIKTLDLYNNVNYQFIASQL